MALRHCRKFCEDERRGENMLAAFEVARAHNPGRRCAAMLGEEGLDLRVGVALGET